MASQKRGDGGAGLGVTARNGVSDGCVGFIVYCLGGFIVLLFYCFIVYCLGGG